MRFFILRRAYSRKMIRSSGCVVNDSHMEKRRIATPALPLAAIVSCKALAMGMPRQQACPPSTARTRYGAE